MPLNQMFYFQTREHDNRTTKQPKEKKKTKPK